MTIAIQHDSLERKRLWSLMVLVLFVTLMAALASTLVRYVNESGVLPIRHIEIRGKFMHLEQDHLRRVLAQVIKGFFTTDLAEVRQAALDTPWIEDIRVRRVWPDLLQIEITEKQLFSRWGEDQMLSVKGEVFKPLRQPEQMPALWLYGRDEDASDVVARYRQLQQMFLPLSLVIQKAGVDARGEWRIELADGTKLIIGNSDADARLRRLLDHYPLLREHQPQPDTIDLRYEQGFAVSWKPAAVAEGSDA